MPPTAVYKICSKIDMQQQIINLLTSWATIQKGHRYHFNPLTGHNTNKWKPSCHIFKSVTKRAVTKLIFARPESGHYLSITYLLIALKTWDINNVILLTSELTIIYPTTQQLTQNCHDIAIFMCRWKWDKVLRNDLLYYRTRYTAATVNSLHCYYFINRSTNSWTRWVTILVWDSSRTSLLTVRPLKGVLS